LCGITGFVDWERDVTKDRIALENMTNTLSARGPDDTGVWLVSHVGLGHKRLAIIDIEGGAQPMSKDKDGFTYTLIYNGELYNTEALREKLQQKGYFFNTSSDTEVLLTAYLEWKEVCVEYLNGIFAFAIWDGEKEQLFIARDRMGVKPLFYHQKGSQLIFGSELKAILEHPNITSEIDRSGLSEIFGLGPSRTPGHGIFKGMKELRGGHYLTFSKEGLKVERYWNVKSAAHTDTEGETVKKVRDLFVEAVERQLVSDVPVSTLLSGGLDSSAITAIAANYFERHGEGQLDTFSLDYEGNDTHFKANKFQPSSDRDWFEKMAENFETNHHDEVISGKALAELLKEAVDVRDQPGQADIDSSMLWFCQQIKEHTPVALSGECADEIFGGYPWFKDPNHGEDGFPWLHSLDSRIDLLHPEWQEKLDLKNYVNNRYEETIAETPRLEGEERQDARHRELFYVNMQWFMAQLLDRSDRMRMGAGLEIRVPYADHHLVEYVWNIPWDMKNLGGYEKGILRKAMEGILPDDVLYRKKSPYPRSFQPEYTENVVNWMKEILADPNARLFDFVRREKIEAIVETEGEDFKEPWYGQLMQVHS